MMFSRLKQLPSVKTAMMPSSSTDKQGYAMDMARKENFHIKEVLDTIQHNMLPIIKYLGIIEMHGFFLLSLILNL